MAQRPLPGVHQQMTGSSKKSRSLSPAHLQALNQLKLKQRQQQAQLAAGDASWSEDSASCLHAFPTPPSQHSYASTMLSQPDSFTALLDSCAMPLLTPSPESTVSPGHWSTSSPDSPEQLWTQDSSPPAGSLMTSQRGTVRY